MSCLSRRRKWIASPYFMRGPQYNVAGSDARKSFQMIGALPFLPNSDVDMARRLFRPTLPPEMSSFADYMYYTRIGTSSRAPLFNQWSLNHWDATLLGIPRSSSIAERWHNGFKSLVCCSHPTIWKFLKALKLDQATTDMQFCNHLMRNPSPPSQKKWVQLDARLQDVMDHYDDYEVLRYLTIDRDCLGVDCELITIYEVL